MIAPIQVYKASAGSGKTFRLAVEYLKLLLAEPNAYRQILAVSFTNKATAEMKERILGELYGMAYHCQDSDNYLNIILNEGIVIQGELKKLNEDNIRALSKSALHAIIHDYNFFNIETIDSFYQRVLRNMAKELNLGSYFNIELDNRKAVTEAVLALIADLKEDSETLDWICRLMEDKVSEEKSIHNIEKDIVSTAIRIFDEAFKRRQNQLKQFFSDKKTVDQYIRELYSNKRSALAAIKQKSDAFFHLLEELNIPESDLNSRGLISYFKKLQKDKFALKEVFTDKQYESFLCEDFTWFKKGNGSVYAEQLLTSHLITTEEVRKEQEFIINSCDLILKNIRNMGLLFEISEKLYNLNYEKNRFLLADTATLINTFISEDDTSFVYEKLGATLNHILIDEFQDTSDMQWENFRALFNENIAKGSGNLIVGDVKQAIYRWRNSNWETLNDIDENFPAWAIQIHNLSTNWRTDSVIVDFNNRLFASAIRFLDNHFENRIRDKRPDLLKTLNKAYADVEQKPIAKKLNAGYVEVRFVPKEERASQQGKALVETILKLKENGVKANDIMILLRYKNKVNLITDAFETYLGEHPELSAEERIYFNLVSDEAFKFSSSEHLNLIIHALKVCINPKDYIALAELAYAYQNQINPEINRSMNQIFRQKEEDTSIINHFKTFLPKGFADKYSSLSQKPLYELIEEIIFLFNLQENSSQESFLYAFLDAVNSFISQNDASITKFLNYWDDELSRKTIVINEQTEGIRVLTVHKSKGLEFHSVIVPFCEWNLETDANKSEVWHEQESDTFLDKVPLLPLDYSDKMMNSVFKNTFQEETMRLWVDNLNLLYVALTRPKHNLFVLADLQEKESSKVSELIRNSVELKDGIFEQGKIKGSEHCGISSWDGNVFKKTSKNQPTIFSSGSKNRAFHLSQEAKQKFEEYISQSHESLSRGLLFHQLMENINYLPDRESAVQKLIDKGLIKADEKDFYLSWLNERLHNPLVKDWFSEGFQLFNERNIVTKDANGILISRRPDRVMLNPEDGRLIILDYKTGEKYDRYKTKLQSYAQIIRDIHWGEHIQIKSIEAYLWYLDSNELETVTIN